MRALRIAILLGALFSHLAIHAAAATANSTAIIAQPLPSTTGAGSTTPPPVYPRAVGSWLEAQIALARQGFSCGPIDGVEGPQTLAALRAFQQSAGLTPTAALDAPTLTRLQLASPPLAGVVLTEEELASIQPLSPTWLGKSLQNALAHETLLELLAERTHASQALLRELNPSADWITPLPNIAFIAPAIGPIPFPQKAARLHVRLADRTLEAHDSAGRVIAHFPVSIAREIDKRPTGTLQVTVVIKNPDYTFNPLLFPDSPEARELGRKLILPPGPNNPVGVAWIGLDRESFGIHGTPQPEKIGRTDSKGCFRLANWDAQTLVNLAWVGLPVFVDP